MEAPARHESGDLALSNEQSPRSYSYDPKWVLDNQMGLNPLWLTEWACENATCAGTRLLDLGCGKGLSSIFLVKRYDVQVWAVDLWIKPTEHYDRFRQSGVQDRASPVHGDARHLPFADQYFSAVICTDALIYFGTDDLCLKTLRHFV